MFICFLGCGSTRYRKNRCGSSNYIQHLPQFPRAEDSDCYSFQSGKKKGMCACMHAHVCTCLYAVDVHVRTGGAWKHNIGFCLHDNLTMGTQDQERLMSVVFVVELILEYHWSRPDHSNRGSPRVEKLRGIFGYVVIDLFPHLPFLARAFTLKALPLTSSIFLLLEWIFLKD